LLQQFIRNWVKRGRYRLDHHCKGCLCLCDDQKRVDTELRRIDS
jgi:hypothetical protein